MTRTYLQSLSKVVDSIKGISLGGVVFNTYERDSLFNFDSSTMFKFSRVEDSLSAFDRYCNSKELQKLVDSRVVTKAMYLDRSFKDNFEKIYKVFDSLQSRYGDFYITTPDRGYFVVNGKVCDEFDLSNHSHYKLSY